MFSPFWQSLHGTGRQPNEPFFGSSFFGKLDMIRVFTAHDWLSSKPRAKIMAHKTIFDKN